MPDEDIIEVIITAPDETWLVDFTHRLIERHLAACGHTRRSGPSTPGTEKRTTRARHALLCTPARSSSRPS